MFLLATIQLRGGMISCLFTRSHLILYTRHSLSYDLFIYWQSYFVEMCYSLTSWSIQRELPALHGGTGSIKAWLDSRDMKTTLWWSALHSTPRNDPQRWHAGCRVSRQMVLMVSLLNPLCIKWVGKWENWNVFLHHFYLCQLGPCDVGLTCVWWLNFFFFTLNCFCSLTFTHKKILVYQLWPDIHGSGHCSSHW